MIRFGSCIGVKGSRIQSVSGELMNERIDIIRWADQPAEYVMSALSPATISSIIVHEDEHKVEVVTLTLTTARSRSAATASTSVLPPS